MDDVNIAGRKPILANQIKKYADPINHYVYKLTYAGKYVIVKGKTIDGSLYLIEKGYWWFTEKKTSDKTHYRRLYRHIKRHPRGRFRLDVLFQGTNQSQLLILEQQVLDMCRYDKNCLNNTKRAYLPLWNEKTKKYLWIEESAVSDLEVYFSSPERKRLLRLYRERSGPKPAKSA